jgi:hypothetical protein
VSRDDVRANPAEADSADYQARNARQLNHGDRLGWGTWDVPEEEVHALGDVRGLATLELGCDACQLGIKVAMRGARVTGLDYSANQLAGGLVVEDLIELRPAEDVTTTYQSYSTLEWARDFPAEHIWKVRKA